jgi:hypothetical protein
MALPLADASDDAWADFLEELHANPLLVPRRQKLAKLEARFTAVLAEPHAAGGAEISLFRYTAGGEREVLGAGRIPPA